MKWLLYSVWVLSAIAHGGGGTDPYERMEEYYGRGKSLTGEILQGLVSVDGIQGREYVRYHYGPPVEAKLFCRGYDYNDGPLLGLRKEYRCRVWLTGEWNLNESSPLPQELDLRVMTLDNDNEMCYWTPLDRRRRYATYCFRWVEGGHIAYKRVTGPGLYPTVRFRYFLIPARAG